MASSNDVQRLFLQAVLSRRILSQQLAAKIWEKCIEAVKTVNQTLDIEYNDNRTSWDDWVTKLNTSLNPLDLEFAHLFDETSGKDMYALVNRKGDQVAQMATEYTAAEIAYFKGVLEQIMLAPNESYCVSSLAALREVNSLKTNMTKTQAESVLGSFVAKGWLLRSKKGRYSLSTRTMLELQPYLRSTYPDEILECTICMEIVTRGIACYTSRCKTRMHNHCYNNYRRRNQNCPACNQNWSTEANAKKVFPIGEDAFKDGQDKGKRRTRRVAEGSDEEEPQMDMDEDASQQTQTQQPTQTQGRSKKGKKKATQDDDMTVDEDEEDATPPPRTQKRKGRR